VRRPSSTILGELDQAQTELVGKAVILTDGKAGTVEEVWHAPPSARSASRAASAARLRAPSARIVAPMIRPPWITRRARTSLLSVAV
jgi:hypothetical protein